MARTFIYNGDTFTSLKDIAKKIGVNRIRPKNFGKYGIKEVSEETTVTFGYIATDDAINGESTIPTTTSTEEFPFKDASTRVELTGINGESFHKRAFVTTVENHDFIIKYLVSYGGVVAMVTEDKYDDGEATVSNNGKMATVYGTYSSQTLAHIKAFLQQEGFVAENVTQIREDYMK